MLLLIELLSFVLLIDSILRGLLESKIFNLLMCLGKFVIFKEVNLKLCIEGKKVGDL